MISLSLPRFQGCLSTLFLCHFAANNFRPAKAQPAYVSGLNMTLFIPQSFRSDELPWGVLRFSGSPLLGLEFGDMGMYCFLCFLAIYLTACTFSLLIQHTVWHLRVEAETSHHLFYAVLLVWPLKNFLSVFASGNLSFFFYGSKLGGGRIFFCSFYYSLALNIYI